MSDFEVTSPDGQKFIITAPEGATQDQILGYAKSNMPQATPKPQESPLGPLGRFFGDYSADPRTARGMGYLGGLTNQLGQGGTFGLADEAAAAGSEVGSAFKSLVRGEPYNLGQQYNERLSQIRGSNRQFQSENPVASTIAQMVGGFGSTAPTVAPMTGITTAAPQSESLLRTAAKSGAIGAGYGALSGFGSGEGDLGNRALNAGISGAIGGVTGAAVPVLISGAQAGWKAIGNALGTRDPTDVALSKLTQAFQRDNIPLEEANRRIAEWQANGAKPEMLVDLGGENVKSVVRAAASHPGPGQEQAVTALRERQSGQAGRLLGDVNQAVPAQSYLSAEDTLTTNLRDNANKAYDAWRNSTTGTIFSPDMMSILERPTMQRALGSAKLNAADEGRNIAIAIEGKQISGLSPEAINDVKTALDGMIQSEGQNQITGALNNRGRIINNLKNQFLDSVEGADKTGLYAAARAQYAGDFEAIQALREGRDFLKMAPDEIRSYVAKMSVGEQQAFKTGVADSLKEVIAKTDDMSNAAKALGGSQGMGGKSIIRDRIEAAFGDQATFKQWADAVRREMIMSDTMRVSPRAGSQTEPRGAAAEALTENLGFWRQLMAGRPGAAIATGISRGVQRAEGITPAVSSEIVNRSMIAPPQQSVQDLLDRLSRNQQNQAVKSELYRRIAAGLGASEGVRSP